MKYLEKKCKESNSFSWTIASIGIVLMIIIALI